MLNSKNHIHEKCPWNVTVYQFFFFFQSGVSLNRKQQQQLVCSDEVRLEFFLKKTLCHDGSFLMSEPNQSVHGFLSLTMKHFYLIQLGRFTQMST